MFRNTFRFRTYHWGGLVPFYDYRDPYDDTERVARKPPETGWERVKDLFEYKQNGYASKEYVSTMQMTWCSFGIAFTVGALHSSITAFNTFLQVNQHTKFVSAYEARRKLSDTVILEGFKKGIKYGLKCSLFTFITGMGIIIIAAYRDKHGILEYTVATGLAGAIVRLYTGVVGTAVGLGLGAFIGTFVGAIIKLIEKVSGTTIEDTQTMLFDFKASRDKGRSDTMEKLRNGDFASTRLKQWVEQRRKRPEHQLADEDKRYFVQSPETTDVEVTSNENSNERESKYKTDAGEVPVANHEKPIVEEKLESSNR